MGCRSTGCRSMGCRSMGCCSRGRCSRSRRRGRTVGCGGGRVVRLRHASKEA